MLDEEAWISSMIEEQQKYIEQMQTLMCNHSDMINTDNNRSSNKIARVTTVATGISNQKVFNDSFPIDTCQDVNFSRSSDDLMCESLDYLANAQNADVSYYTTNNSGSRTDASAAHPGSKKDVVAHVTAFNADVERLSGTGVGVAGFSSILYADGTNNNSLEGDELEKAEKYVALITGKADDAMVLTLAVNNGLTGTKKGEYVKLQANSYVSRKSVVDQLASSALSEKRRSSSMGLSKLAAEENFINRRIGSEAAVEWQKKIAGGDGNSNEVVVLREMAVLKAFEMKQNLQELRSALKMEMALATQLANKIGMQ
jgi:hypothetical protein